MNIVDRAKDDIIELASDFGLDIRFTQTNHGKFVSTCRAYLHPLGTHPHNCHSREVEKIWQWPGPIYKGVTSKSARYRAFIKIEEYLINRPK